MILALYTDIYIIQITMRDEREGEEGESHADEGEGMRRRYPARRSLELGGGARKRQELTAVSNLSVQRYIILILTRRERKKKQKKNVSV